jgi:acyl dehydratase
MTLLTDELRLWIGREVRYTAPDELGRASIRYFALAVGDDNPLYTDAEFARAHGYADVVAPRTLVCETNQYLHRPPDEEGYIGHRWDLPVHGCRLIRGGHEYTFARPVYPTDRITATWRIADIRERTSSRGGSLLMVESEAVYTNQDGELLARNAETLIYQPLEGR